MSALNRTSWQRSMDRLRPLHRQLKRVRQVGAQRRSLVGGGRLLSRLVGGALALAIPGLSLLNAPGPGADGPGLNGGGSGLDAAQVALIVEQALTAHDNRFQHAATLTVTTPAPDDAGDAGDNRRGPNLSVNDVNNLINQRLADFRPAPEIRVQPAMPPAQSVVELAPLDRAWYRTQLREGDYFWALPDANFTLSARDISGCTAPGTCSATIELRRDADVSGTTITRLTNGRFERGALPDCRPVNERIWQCALPEQAPEGLCLWLRSPSNLSEPEASRVAFDVLWRRTSLSGNGPAACSRLSNELAL